MSGYNNDISFELYTLFGRVLRTFDVGPNETHHRALEEARLASIDLDRQYNGRVWIRQV